uniref:Uncharacterized protein n=1 Tax=Vespula pensylvanica TaxID=30213 RepID=A0A834JQH8_VESPE|nr:hypothetical protein H0235_017436 [Vespula pensylvanica]
MFRVHLPCNPPRCTMHSGSNLPDNDQNSVAAVLFLILSLPTSIVKQFLSDVMDHLKISKPRWEFLDGNIENNRRDGPAGEANRLGISTMAKASSLVVTSAERDAFKIKSRHSRARCRLVPTDSRISWKVRGHRSVDTYPSALGIGSYLHAKLATFQERTAVRRNSIVLPRDFVARVKVNAQRASEYVVINDTPKGEGTKA